MVADTEIVVSTVSFNNLMIHSYFYPNRYEYYMIEVHNVINFI